MKLFFTGWFCTAFYFFPLRTILRAALLTVFNTGSIERTTYYMITYTRKILNTTTADKHD